MRSNINCLLDSVVVHPEMKERDAVKFLYQSVFSTGHMIGEKTEEFIAEERKGLSTADSLPLFECVGTEYARFNLNAAGAEKISGKTIALAMKSCMNIDRRWAEREFCESVKELCGFIERGAFKLPFSAGELEREMESVRKSGYAPVSHSESYRALYRPAYRLVPMWFKTYFEVIAGADELSQSGKPATIAIDGGSACGKSTLAERLSSLFDCNVWHMDDFFLQKHQRTQERLACPGGNVDYERFYSEVFKPLMERRDIRYKRFDCSKMELGETVDISFKPLNIVEGAYSCRPEFEKGYALKVFLKTSYHNQKRRIFVRNGDNMLSRFVNEWIPMEHMYFNCFDIEEKADIVLTV